MMNNKIKSAYDQRTIESYNIALIDSTNSTIIQELIRNLVIKLHSVPSNKFIYQYNVVINSITSSYESSKVILGNSVNDTEFNFILKKLKIYKNFYTNTIMRK